MVYKRDAYKEKILPYFGNYRICDIKPIDVLRWQNTIMDLKMKMVCRIRLCILKQFTIS